MQRQLVSANTHGETLEAQVGVFRRGRQLEQGEDRLFAHFLRNCLCPACVPGAVAAGAIPPVPEGVPPPQALSTAGVLAAVGGPDDLMSHCTASSSTAKVGGAMRVPQEVAVLVNKHFDELSTRADAQRAQISQLQQALAGRDGEVERLNDSCKAMQAALDAMRAQHRATETSLVLETAARAAANVRCDDAVRNVHLLKAALRQTLEENDRVAKELDRQLTRIQVIDANEAREA